MSKIILTKGVKEYRATIPQYVQPNDVVLEVGFAWGTTCNILSRYAGKVVGIDKGESYYQAVKTYPNIELYKIDGFDMKSVLDLGYKFTKVYIDISGCRSVFDIVQISMMYDSAFKPEVIVLKTSRLKKFVSRCEVWQNTGT